MTDTVTPWDPARLGGHEWRSPNGGPCARCGLRYTAWSGEDCPNSEHVCGLVEPVTRIACCRADPHPGSHEGACGEYGQPGWLSIRWATEAFEAGEEKQ